MPPKAKKAAPKADRKYSYLPRGLQRAAQHMDRVAFLRQLQRAQSDRQHKHVTTQTGSELSSTGAVDLAGKIDLVRSELKSAMSGLGTAIVGGWPVRERRAFHRAIEGLTMSPRAASPSAGHRGPATK